jgi:hypothetical protein
MRKDEMTSSETILLQCGNELRLISTLETPVTIIIKSGSCECFGAKLTNDNKYTFINRNVAINCKTKSSKITLIYSFKDKYHCFYTNVHVDRSVFFNDVLFNGQRIIITGQENTGKSTLCEKLLHASAEKIKETSNTWFVDLDVNQGSVSLPGVMSVTLFDKNMFDIEMGLCSLIKNSHLFSFGFTHYEDAPLVYLALLKSISSSLDKLITVDDCVVFNLPTISKCNKLKFLCDFFLIFPCIKYITIIEDDYTRSIIKKIGKNLHGYILSKDGGVVVKNESNLYEDTIGTRQLSQLNSVLKYFEEQEKYNVLSEHALLFSKRPVPTNVYYTLHPKRASFITQGDVFEERQLSVEKLTGLEKHSNDIFAVIDTEIENISMLFSGVETRKFIRLCNVEKEDLNCVFLLIHDIY